MGTGSASPDGFSGTFRRGRGFLPDGHHGHKIGAKLGYLAAGNPRNQVQPVSADIGNGTELAAKFRIEPPVPIAWIEQPVLQETAMHEFGLTDSAFFN